MALLSFVDLIAWQKAQDLAVEVYKEFKELRDFSFKDQICRAVVSVSNNIAEGYERSSKADFNKFLFYSMAPCSEVKSMLFLAERLKYIDSHRKEELLNSADEVSRLIRGLMKSLK